MYYTCEKCGIEAWNSIEEFRKNRTLTFDKNIYNKSLPVKNIIYLTDSQTIHSNNSVFIDGCLYLVNDNGKIYSKYMCWLTDEDVLVKEVIE